MPNDSSDHGEITNLMLLQHMQGMRSGLERQMAGMRTSLEKRMDRMELEMKDGFRETKKETSSINDALQRLYTHRVSMLGRIEKLEEVVGIAQ